VNTSEIIAPRGEEEEQEEEEEEEEERAGETEGTRDKPTAKKRKKAPIARRGAAWRGRRQGGV